MTLVVVRNKDLRSHRRVRTNYRDTPKPSTEPRAATQRPSQTTAGPHCLGIPGYEQKRPQCRLARFNVISNTETQVRVRKRSAT